VKNPRAGTAGIAAGVSPALADVLQSLARKGLGEAEVYAKRGRSRRLETSPSGEASSFAQERAWAVRAGDAGGEHGSFFLAGTGEPRADLAWPEPASPPIALPRPEPAPPWSEPADFDAPLIGEAEGFQLLASFGRELAAELPGTRVLRAALEDGWSEAEVASSRGVAARTRRRAASLHVEARGPRREAPSASLYLAARGARQFPTAALARRLADRLAVAAAPPVEGDLLPGPPGSREVLLAPTVGIHLLAALLPLLVGPRAVHLGTGLRDRRGRLGSDLLTLIDDGRLTGGALEAPVDGEGVPTLPVAIVEAGIFRQPLLAWWQAAPWEAAGAAAGVPSGCSRRAGWRDLPAPGPTHLYLAADPRTSVGSLLGTIDRGAYLIDVAGAPRVDLESLRFELPACGFLVERGRATAPLPRALLRGSVGALLKGIAGVARDLAFLPLDGMIGAPTLLVGGLELQGGAGP
jgi:predicted Zn-dependent protease